MSKSIKQEDHAILEIIKEDETRHRAFRMIVETYSERLYWHIRRMVVVHADADDVLQNTFLKIWEALANFRGESSLYTWMYRIATNESINFLNGKKKRQYVFWDQVEHRLSNSLESEPYFNGDALEVKLQQAILGLPPKQRTIFLLRYYDEMKYEDMSEVLGTSVGALKASYHHAYQKIQKQMLNHLE
jgi:RNA polymerase sigma-70 factor (ECF subfamily)